MIGARHRIDVSGVTDRGRDGGADDQGQTHQRLRAHLAELRRLSAAAESLTAVLDAAREQVTCRRSACCRAGLLGIEVAAVTTPAPRSGCCGLRGPLLALARPKTSTSPRQPGVDEEADPRARASLLDDAGNVLLIGQSALQDDDRHRPGLRRGDRGRASVYFTTKGRPGQRRKRAAGLLEVLAGHRDAGLRPEAARDRRVRLRPTTSTSKRTPRCSR